MALSVLLAAALASLCVAAPQQFSIPRFPLQYTGSLKAVQTNFTGSRHVTIDVANQLERVDLADGSGTYFISLYKKNITYWMSLLGTRPSCNYYKSPGAVNGSLAFPAVSSFATVGVVQIDGKQCQESTGAACLQLSGAPLNPMQPNPPTVCGTYTYFAEVSSALPVRFVLFDPARPSVALVTVDYANVSTTISNSSFVLPPASECSAFHTCAYPCNPPAIHDIFGIPFCNVGLIPSWLLAVVIGLGSAYAVLTKVAKGVVGRVCYSLSFGTYAFMISSGFVVHCVFLVECGKSVVDQESYTIWTYIDAGLTSCIATSFFFNGLVDLRVIFVYFSPLTIAQLLSEKAWQTYALMLAAYVAIFYLYFATIISLFYLYEVVIFIGCGGYCVMQLVVLFRRKSLKGIGFALTAAIAGFVGLVVPHIFYCFFCKINAAWFPEAMWYYLSDLAVLLLCFFVLATRVPAPPPSKKALDSVPSAVVSYARF